jgi:PKD repeat protein/flagellar hook assembly protein FlgD
MLVVKYGAIVRRIARLVLAFLVVVGVASFSVGNAAPNCTEYNTSNYEHVAQGRASVCNLFYVCAIGSGINLGFYNIFTTTRLVEESPGYFAPGLCVTGECHAVTNAEHQSSGRAYAVSNGWWWYVTTQWFANGTNEVMGSQATQTVALEKTGVDQWRVVTACPVIVYPTVEFSASRQTIIVGESTQLNWSTENAESVEISPDIGSVALEDSVQVAPQETTLYQIKATGSGGGETVKTLEIKVTPSLAANISASVTKGVAPLTVRLSPLISTTNAVNRYYWDFEGNGGVVDGGLGTAESSGFDKVESLLNQGIYLDFDSTGRDFEFEYKTPGVYTPRLRVWDADGVQSMATISIEVDNAPPDVVAKAYPTNGQIPLTVQFEVNASDNEGIANYQWDFNGDGVIDVTSSETWIQHTFTTIGQFRASVTVTDVLGVSTKLQLPHIEIRAVPEGDPSVELTAVNVNGDVPLTVSFSAIAHVPDGSSDIFWEWDFTGNGDFQAGESTIEHTYMEAGIYYAWVRATTATGKIALDVVEVKVEPKFDLSIIQKSFDPTQYDAFSLVQTRLYGTTEVSLHIESRSGGWVKTIQDWTVREPGVYEDAWDGKDANQEILPPGDYYVVMGYKLNGAIHRFDLRKTSGGEIFYPVDTDWQTYCVRGITPCGTVDVPDHSLEPFNNLPYVYDFTIPHLADMTAYMSIFKTNKIVLTFFQKLALANGSHQLVWNGEGTDGRLLSTVDSKYLITLMGHTLASNAIFLNHLPRLQDSRVDPVVFDPSRRTGPGMGKAKLLFLLDKPSVIDFWVTDMDTGKEVYRTQVYDLEASEVAIEWDGRNNRGEFVAPGSFLLSARALFMGQTSIPVSGVVRVKY